MSIETERTSANILFRRLAAPFIVILTIGTVLVGALTVIATRSQDTISINASIHLTRSVLSDVQRKLAEVATEYTYWDEAVEKAVTAFDIDWVEVNLGTYLGDTFDISAVYVLDEGNRLVYAMVDGKRSSADPFDRFADAASILVERARIGPSDAFPQAGVGLVRDGVGIHVVAASVFTDYEPDGNKFVNQRTQSVLVLVRPLDADLLKTLADGYLLPELHVSETTLSLPFTSLALNEPNGSPIGFLSWRAQLPGSELLVWLLPVVIVTFLFAAAASVFRLFKGAQSVVTDQAREIDARIRAELDLRKAHDEMGRRVKERTEHLEQQIAETEIARAALQESRDIAEVANRAKSEFLSSMSHELRTPLNAILGFGQLLEAAEESLKSDHRSYVRHVIEGGEHLLRLIDQILELSKIETGSVDLRIDEVSSKEILDESLSFIQADAVKRNITIEREFADQTLPIILTDAMRLKQILLNLLSNAVKYNKIGGRITVNCGVVAGDLCRISIADTGPGIPEEKQDQIFEPFNRLGRESGNIEGTGIGLTVTKQLVGVLGGNIGFFIGEEGGTTFWIEMPLQKGEVQEEDKPMIAVSHDRRQEEAERESRTILHVEDNPSSAQLMEAIIQQGFDAATKLIVVPDAEQGIALATARPPDLILMDLNLPGIDGFDAMKQLRECEKTCRIPVIALTADAMPHQIEMGNEAGFHAYLTKPVDVAQIQEIVRDVWPMAQPLTKNEIA